MAVRISVTGHEMDRLRDLVDQQSGGRDAEARSGSAPSSIAPSWSSARAPAPSAMGARVRYRHEESGVEREITLVYPGAADASAGRVSVLAPIGAALLGLSAGDAIDWPLPRGRSTRIRIASVEPPEEGAAATA